MHFSKPTTTLALLATGTAAQNSTSGGGYTSGGVYGSGGGYLCPIQQSTEDMTSVEYGWVVQNFLYKYYTANGEFSASDFAKVPMADMMASNGMTKAENLATNMNGLTTQSMLGLEGLQELGATQMDCDYSYPSSVQDDPMAFVVAAAYIEATLCGTFIGLADYVQQPTSAFLMARLAAEHGIHGSFLRSLMDPTPYSANSTSLTPAFTPMQALQVGSGMAVRDNVGNLGAFIPNSCAPMPMAPCGGDVDIGMINAKLSGGSMGSATTTAFGVVATGYGSSNGASSTTYVYPSSTPSTMGGGSSSSSNGTIPTPEPFTGAGSKSSVSTVLVGAAGAVAALFA